MPMVRREVAGVPGPTLTAGRFWEVRQSDVGVVFPLGPSKNQGQVVELGPLDKNPDYHWPRPTLDAWLDGIILLQRAALMPGMDQLPPHVGSQPVPAAILPGREDGRKPCRRRSL